MSAPGSAPLSLLTEAPKKPRILWKWSLLIVTALVVWLMWECGSGLMHGRALSNTAVRHFHDELNAGDFESIYKESDVAFQQASSKEEVLKLFEGVHRKLGNAISQQMTSLNVNASTNGTFITALYITKFEHGDGEETFTWRKSVTGQVKLVSYNVQSKAFILN